MGIVPTGWEEFSNWMKKGEVGGTAPPSVLPDIFPTWGGDWQFGRCAPPATFEIGDDRQEI
jgi:hypothetical protein